MTKKLFNCLLIIFLFSIVSCSNDTSKNNIENKPEIYNFYETELNTEGILGGINNTYYNETFHKVTEYNCIDDGDNYYLVQKQSIHYFLASKYDADEQKLINIIKNKTITPTDKEMGVTVRTFGLPTKNVQNEDCFLYTTTIIKYEKLLYK